MPGLIPSAELAQIQADAAAAALDKTCVIQRSTGFTQDGTGTRVPSYATIATVNAGMTLPSAGELANYDYLIGDKASWTVRLPIGTDVTHQDHLIIESQVLEVHVLLTPRSYPALASVIAVEIK